MPAVGLGYPDKRITPGLPGPAQPSSRVVYVDYDPVVSTHARALLTSHPRGRPTTCRRTGQGQPSYYGIGRKPG